MPIDTTLIAVLLRVLFNNLGRDPISEELAGLDAETILRRPVTTAAVRSALQQCKTRGWVNETEDDFGQPVWALTDAGLAKVDKQ